MKIILKISLLTIIIGMLSQNAFASINALNISNEIEGKNTRCLELQSKDIICYNKKNHSFKIIKNEKGKTLIKNNSKIEHKEIQGALKIDVIDETASRKKRKVKNKVPNIKLNGDRGVYIEKGERFIDLGASWKDAEDGEGLVLAKKVLKKNLKTNEYEIFSGKITTYKIGDKFRLLYTYTDSNNSISKTQVRFVEVVEKKGSKVYSSNQNSCTKQKLICKENIVGEKTWQLKKGGFCIGEIMNKIGELCEPPKEGKKINTRSVYYGSDNFKGKVLDLEKLKIRAPFTKREIMDIEYEYEEEVELTAAPEVILENKEEYSNKDFVKNMKLFYDQNKNNKNKKSIAIANQVLVEKILERGNNLNNTSKLSYYESLFNDLEEDSKKTTNSAFKLYIQYFQTEIAKKVIQK